MTPLCGGIQGATAAWEVGTLVAGSETRYYPYGEVRTSGQAVAGLTDFTYTGQQVDAATGLMFYNARWYDPALGRFVSADTIVPEPGNPQALNRYAYVANNPLKYIDPSGHGWLKKLAKGAERLATNAIVHAAKSNPVVKAQIVNVAEVTVDPLKAIGDAKRNPSMAGFHDNFWSGVKAWKGAFDNMGTAANYTGSAVAEGRWKDAARGAEGLGQMGETLAQVPGKVATQMVVGTVTFPARVVNDAWAFGTAARECAQGKRGGWDVVWHGTMLAGDVTSIYTLSGARGRYGEMRTASRTGQQLSGKFPANSQSGYLYRSDSGGTVTAFARYDAAGRIMYRVDMLGPAHGGVPTPHLHPPLWNTNPTTGVTYFNGWGSPTYFLRPFPIFLPPNQWE